MAIMSTMAIGMFLMGSLWELRVGSGFIDSVLGTSFVITKKVGYPYTHS